MRTEYESEAWVDDRLVVGIDEAGRGPLAGPCVVCGVVFPLQYSNDEINDSKQLSAKKRKQLAEIIYRDAIEIRFEIIEPIEIDTLNIYQATKEAMKRIAIASKSDYVLTDAMPLIIDKEVLSLIKGDAKSISIGAASILAKTKRDEIMEAYALEYPQYGFEKHKGYGTKQHVNAIEQFGYTPIHRKSFHLKAKQTSLKF